MSTRGTLSFLVSGCAPDRRRAVAVQSTLSDRRYDVSIKAADSAGEFSPDARPRVYADLVEEIADGAVDGGICPAWALPSTLPTEVRIAAVLSRNRREDLLVTESGSSLEDLPPAPIIGACSSRVRTQLRNQRADGQIQPIDGSTTTQIKRLLAPALQAEHERRLDAAESEDSDDSFAQSPDEWFQQLDELERQALEMAVETEYDGIVLPAADVDRLGFRDRIASISLPAETFVPTAGQGTTVILTNERSMTERLNQIFEDPVARTEMTVERTIEAALPADIAAVTGVTAFVQGPYVRTVVSVPVADDVVIESRDLSIERHRSAARGFIGDIQSEYTLVAPDP